MIEIEYILCSAIHFDDGKKHPHQPVNIDSGFVVCGLRHHNCYGTLYALGIIKNGKWTMRKGIDETQGFLTSKDRFVDRMMAAKIAQEAKQISAKRVRSLMSEDLW
jgi:hypothetical protein